MNDKFLTYLAHASNEFSQYSKKYGTPSLKKINKIVSGSVLHEEPVCRKNLMNSGMFYLGTDTHNDVQLFVQNFQMKMIDIVSKLMRIPDYVKMNSFRIEGFHVVVYYEVLEPLSDYNSRLVQYDKIVELNKLSDIIRSHAKEYESNSTERINEIRRIGIERKIAELQNELRNL